MSFSRELFFQRGVGESVKIPFGKIDQLMIGQKGLYRDVTRRGFCAYIATKLGRRRREVCTGKPSIMKRLCSFSQKEGFVEITKNEDIECFMKHSLTRFF